MNYNGLTNYLYGTQAIPKRQAPPDYPSNVMTDANDYVKYGGYRPRVADGVADPINGNNPGYDFENPHGYVTQQTAPATQAEDVTEEDMSRAVASSFDDDDEEDDGGAAPAAPSQEEEIQKVADVAAGKNPYILGQGIPSITELLMRPHYIGGVTEAAKQPRLSRQQRREMANPFPTNFADPFYKMRLAHAMRAQGTPTADVEAFFKAHNPEIDMAIKKARAEENMYALQKAISGNNINASDLALGHMVTENPALATFMGGRVPSFRNAWDLMNQRETAEINANRALNNQKELKNMDYNNKLNYLYQHASVELNKAMQMAGIKRNDEIMRRQQLLSWLVGQGVDPSIALQMAIGGSNGSRQAQQQQSKMSQKEQEFANEYEQRLAECYKQVQSGDTSSTALSDMHEWLFKHRYKYTEEQWENEIYAPLYQLENKWEKLGEVKK